jgi:hypothetical protein
MTIRTKKVLYASAATSAVVTTEWADSLTRFTDGPVTQAVYVSLAANGAADPGALTIQISPSKPDHITSGEHSSNIIYDYAVISVGTAKTTVVNIDTPCDSVRVIKDATTSVAGNVEVILYG